MMTAESCVQCSLQFANMVGSDNFDFEIEEEDLWKSFAHLLKENFIITKNANIKNIADNEAENTLLKSSLGKRSAPSGKKVPVVKEKLNKKSKKMYMATTDLFNVEFADSFAQKANENIKETSEEILGNFGAGVTKDIETGLVGSSNPIFYNVVTGEKQIFVVNYRKVIHELRTTKIVNLAKERLDKLHGQLLHVILKQSHIYGRAFDVRHTEPLSLDEIIRGIPNNRS